MQLQKSKGIDPVKWLVLIGIIVLCIIWSTALSLAQTPDFVRTKKVGDQNVVDARPEAYLSLQIPRWPTFTLNGAKDSVGYIMYNTTINKLGVYKGSGQWDTLGVAVAFDDSNLLHTTGNETKTGNLHVTGFLTSDTRVRVGSVSGAHTRADPGNLLIQESPGVGTSIVGPAVETGTVQIQKDGLNKAVFLADSLTGASLNVRQLQVPNFTGTRTIATTADLPNLAAYQTTANLQTDLTASATKYPSVNAVNTGLLAKANTNGANATGTWPVSISGHSFSTTSWGGQTFNNSGTVPPNQVTNIMALDGSSNWRFFPLTSFVVTSLDDPNDLQVPSSQAVATAINTAVGSLDVADSEYTPTITNNTNTDTQTANIAMWTRIGNTVSVSGTVMVDPTTAGLCTVSLQLPINSALTVDAEIAGIASSNLGVTNQPIVFFSATFPNSVTISFLPVDTTEHKISYTYKYTIKE